MDEFLVVDKIKMGDVEDSKPLSRSPTEMAKVPNSVQTVETSLAEAKQSDSDRQSNQHESEYDTASDSPSDDDLQSGDYDEDIHSSDDDDAEEEDLNSDLGEEEEEGGEPAAEEGEEGEEKKKVDDDEDRSNPQYIPKKGTFYEHDDRTAENPPVGAKCASEEPAEPTAESLENVSSAVPLPVKPPPKKPAGGDRWSHDRFDMSEQAPKSRTELVSAYGYDIRSEDGPPKVKRSKHYGRGPTKYDRNWEDENAYGKQVVAKRVPRGPPKGEDFPKLNERRPKKHNSQSRDDHPTASQGSNSEVGEERSHHSSTNNHHNNHSRERRQSGPGRSGGGGGFRGNEKSREFKNRNQSGRGGRDGGGGGGGRDSNRPNRRRDDGGGGASMVRGGGDQEAAHHQEQQQHTFNGMSFTNSSLGHSKRLEGGSNQPRNAASGGDAEETPQRMMPTANASRSVNYGSGRLQRRDDKPMSQPHHFQQQPQQHPASDMSPAGGLPLHAPVPTHLQEQQQPQMPKRYSEKRQGMRSNEQHSQPPSVQQQVMGGMMGEPPMEQHLHQQPVAAVQQQQQQQSHLQQSPGPPPPFMSNRIYTHGQLDMGGVSLQPVSVAQAQPIPAQYTNYYPPDYLPQSTPAQNVVPTPQQQQQAASAAYQQQQAPSQVGAANGPPAQMLNYVPAMQTAPPQQTSAQYSQYPGYQNYAAMPIQAAPAGNVAYYPSAAAQQQPQAQQPPRAILPQRRPTNAIPIVSPPDRAGTAAGGKGRGRLVSEVDAGDAAGPPAKSGDDIDHILDNMFVRRPQQAMTTSTTGGRTKGEDTDKASKVESSLDEGMKDLRLNVAAEAGDGEAASET